MVSDELLAALNRLSAELGRNHYAAATQVVGDQEWLGKLSKLQESIPRVEAASALLRELFPRAEGLKTQCERLLDVDKSWSPEFRLCLTNGIAALGNFLEAKGLRSRIDTLEKELGRQWRIELGAVKDHSARLAVELAASR